jgi:Fanconi anemia group J protein
MSFSPKRSGLTFMGYEIDFPYAEPYQAQRALISNSIASFTKSANALLESPTGTGKTLSLLASSLAYQTHMKNTLSEPSSTLDLCSPYFSKENPLPTNVLNYDRFEQKLSYPRIYYTSRTHSQLKQVVSELKKLKNYRPRLSILASRKEFCLNESRKNDPDLDKKCRAKTGKEYCSYDKNSKSIPKEFYPGGEYDKFDIEEMKNYCRERNLCPYFLARALLREAELVLCPYNYIIDERIRNQMKLDISKSIILFDEGHNIEQTCRDAASLTLSSKDVEYLSDIFHDIVDTETKEAVGPENEMSMRNVLTLIDRMRAWFETSKKDKSWEVKKKGSANINYFPIRDLPLTLSGWSLTSSSWPKLSEDMRKLIKINENYATDVIEKYITDKAALIMSELDVCFNYLLRENSIDEYSLILTNDNDELTMKLLCMSPGIAFQAIDQQTHSIILTSGTLSPLEQYESELRTKFAQKLSAKHVIDPIQVCSMIVTSIDKVQMTSASKVLATSSDKIYPVLGNIILTIVRNVPDGVLLFFPSSTILRNCMNEWEKDQNSIGAKISRVKPIFVDCGRNQRKNQWNFIGKTLEDPLKAYTSSVNQGKGGLLIGVIRGKLSEGIDFVDKHARSVVIFGIPYPSYYSPEVALKRDYNDMNSRRKEEVPGKYATCNGAEWYSAQAYRALAQAVGRCIRNINDYGSIILIDQRFPQDRNKFPRWIQSSISGPDVQSLDEIERRLKNFYPLMAEKFPDSVSGPSEINLNDRVIITHSDCLSRIASAQSLEKTASFNTNSKALFSIFGYDQQEPLALERVKPGDCYILEDGIMGQHVWSEEDGMGYKPIICSRCNEVVGAHVFSTTEEHDKCSQMSSDMFIIDKCNITQKQLSDKMSAYIIKPRSLKMNEGSGGQKTLSFV